MNILAQKAHPFYLLIVFIAIYRILLLNAGALSLVDELVYIETINAVQSLLDGDLHAFSLHISSTSHLPGNNTIRFIPAVVQFLFCEWWGLPLLNPESLKIVTFFNVIISILILIVFYKISLILFDRDQKIAVFAAMIYAFLANTNMYIRHVLPYDISLMVFLFALYLVLKKLDKSGKLDLQTCIITGLLTGFAFSAYYAYYLFPVLIFLLIVFSGNDPIVSRSKALNAIGFGVSAVSIPVLYESIAFFGNSSYLQALFLVAESKYYGENDEGFTFLFKYLIEVESLIGIFLLTGIIFYYVGLFKDSFRAKFKNLRDDSLGLLLVGIFLGYLIHAVLTDVFHSKVFYGRILHIYLPFLVLAIVGLIKQLAQYKFRMGLYSVMFVVSLISFFTFSSTYYSLAYPRDVLHEQGINIENVPYENIINEVTPYLIYASPNPACDATEQTRASGRKYKLINFSNVHAYTARDTMTYIPGENEKLVYDQQHFRSYSAYTYEELFRQRDFFEKKKLNVRVYEVLNGGQQQL